MLTPFTLSLLTDTDVQFWAITSVILMTCLGYITALLENVSKTKTVIFSAIGGFCGTVLVYLLLIAVQSLN